MRLLGERGDCVLYPPQRLYHVRGRYRDVGDRTARQPMRKWASKAQCDGEQSKKGKIRQDYSRMKLSASKKC